MCITLMFIFGFLFGIVALIRGKLAFSSTQVIEGWPARIIGIILMLPIVLSFSFGMMLGSLAALRGVPSDENQYQKAIDNFSLSILILCFFAVLVLAQIYGRRPRPKPPPDGSADVQDVLPG